MHLKVYAHEGQALKGHKLQKKGMIPLGSLLSSRDEWCKEKKSSSRGKEKIILRRGTNVVMRPSSVFEGENENWAQGAKSIDSQKLQSNAKERVSAKRGDKS